MKLWLNKNVKMNLIKLPSQVLVIITLSLFELPIGECYYCDHNYCLEGQFCCGDNVCCDYVNKELWFTCVGFIMMIVLASISWTVFRVFGRNKYDVRNTSGNRLLRTNRLDIWNSNSNFKSINNSL